MANERTMGENAPREKNTSNFFRSSIYVHSPLSSGGESKRLFLLKYYEKLAKFQSNSGSTSRSSILFLLIHILSILYFYKLDRCLFCDICPTVSLYIAQRLIIAASRVNTQ